MRRIDRALIRHCRRCGWPVPPEGVTDADERALAAPNAAPQRCQDTACEIPTIPCRACGIRLATTARFGLPYCADCTRHVDRCPRCREQRPTERGGGATLTDRALEVGLKAAVAEVVATAERQAILAAAEHCRWHRTRMAKHLQITATTLYAKLRQYQIAIPGH